VLSGRVRVVEGITVNAVEMVLGEFGPGEIFGELGVLLQRRRSASVFALERARCLRIPEADFISALEDSSEVALALQRILADRIHETDRLIARTAPDALTGLPSRRAFHYLYRRLAASARRRRSSVVLIAVDIAQLRNINDRYGYSVGDHVIVAVADALVEFSGNTDLVARYGGDEFALLLLDVNVDAAPMFADELQAHLQQMFLKSSLPVSTHCSVGYAASRVAPGTADGLLRRADKDLQNKRSHHTL
jgi:diguanylate cyclase (GGDEF)-like protein